MRHWSVSFAVLLTLAPLAQGASFTKGPATPVYSLVADLNHDGLDDIVNGRSVYANSGGAFTLVHQIDLQPGERILGAVDVNGDGFADLVTYNPALSIPIGLGGGEYAPATTSLLISDGAFHFTRFAAPINSTSPGFSMDIDRDGKDDFVAFSIVWDADRLNVLNGVMTILRSKGDGRFEEWQKITVPAIPYLFAVGDVTGDGRDDLVTQIGDELFVYPATRDNALGDPVIRYLPRSFGALSGGSLKPRLYDIDGDGNNDIVMQGSGYVRVLFGDGHGSFPRYSSVVPPDTKWNSTSPRSVVFGNFTSNARTDLAVSNADGSFFIYSGAGGTLKEVARNLFVEANSVNLVAGAFRIPSQRSDLLVSVIGYGLSYDPVPSLYFGPTPSPAPSKNATTPIARARAVLHPRPVETINVSVKLTGECAPDYTDTWHIVREGIFGVDRGNNRRIDAVVDGDTIMYRVVSRAGSGIPQFSGALAPIGDGHYIDYVAVDTPCGKKSVRLDATISQ